MRRLLPALAFAAAACGVLSPEEQLLRRFFEASRLHDTTAVAGLSAVTFNPRTDGIVQDFEIRDVVRQGEARHLMVAAEVRDADGRVTSRTLAITIRRQGDRWVIADLKPVP